MLKNAFEIKRKEISTIIHSWKDKLGDDQLALDNSQREKFLRILQERYGYSEEKALSELNQHYSKIILTWKFNRRFDAGRLQSR